MPPCSSSTNILSSFADTDEAAGTAEDVAVGTVSGWTDKDGAACFSSSCCRDAGGSFPSRGEER
jgi:hypothetical protein